MKLFENIIVYDVESNGLHGEPFAIGAVVVNSKGTVLDSLFIRSGFRRAIDPWVAKHVLAVLKDPINVTNFAQMANRFMDWTLSNREKYSAEIFADWAVPVDSDFIVECLRFRRGHPVVVHEACTILQLAGLERDADREAFVRDELKDRKAAKHHPLWDAEVSARAIQKSLRMLRSRNVDSKYAAKSPPQPLTDETPKISTPVGNAPSGGRGGGDRNLDPDEGNGASAGAAAPSDGPHPAKSVN